MNGLVVGTKSRMVIDQELLRSLFTYEDGKLFHSRIARGPKPKGGRRDAGCISSTARENRWKIKVFARRYHRARLVWIYHFGDIPGHLLVDHINGNPLDDRIENLRLVTPSENNMNRKVSKNNMSGVTGVSFYAACNRWHAYIAKDCKRIHIGYFGSKEEAIKARAAAEMELFKGFACSSSRL